MNREDAVGLLVGFGRQKSHIERAMDYLTEDEQLLLEMFYIVPKTDVIERLCQELEVERSTVYRRKDKALDKFIRYFRAVDAGFVAGRQTP